MYHGRWDGLQLCAGLLLCHVADIHLTLNSRVITYDILAGPADELLGMRAFETTAWVGSWSALECDGSYGCVRSV